VSSDPPKLPEHGPTELVEGRDGELVERLSTGTATLLLVWLVGVGAGSSLLAAWIFAAVILGQRLGVDDLLSGAGFYVALFGASGPTVLWLSGRAQDRRLGWFVITAAKIGLAMLGGSILIVILGSLLLGSSIGPGALPALALLFGLTLAMAVLWALATWSADRYIAKARVESSPERDP
jgi:hypothetical protein